MSTNMSTTSTINMNTINLLLRAPSTDIGISTNH